MNIKQAIKQQFEVLEAETVSNSFGGVKVEGKAPTFAFKPIMHSLGSNKEHCELQLRNMLSELEEKMSDRCFKYTLECLGRFSFCIELTNLAITSTKMKTRWVTGRITKTRPGTFENYEGNFEPGQDERASSFEDCFEVMFKCLELLTNSNEHIALMESFAQTKKRGTPYESVFTYIDKMQNPVHHAGNIRLVATENASWLVRARPIIQPVLKKDFGNKDTKVIEKIATKCYKTDRSQTGEVQTNRAKRWECLNIDFQHSTIEQCWSVERKLLSDVAHFEGFPEQARQKLIDAGLFGAQTTTLCPITLKPMVFEALLGGGGHGESTFQVGHMMPLKAGGVHEGDNIEWISNDGNRIQGSLNIQDTREMLKGIFERMVEHGLIRN